MNRKLLNGFRIAFVLMIVTVITVYAALAPKVEGTLSFNTAVNSTVVLLGQNLEPGSTNSGDCELNTAPSGQFKIKMVGTYANESCNFSIDVQAGASNTAPVYVGSFLNTDGQLAGIATLIGQTSCGDSIAPGGTKNIPLTVLTDSVVAEGINIAAATIDIEFPAAAAACP